MHKESKILIIDDTKQNVTLLEAILECNNYTSVDSLTDSRLAEQAYREGNYDLVLLDIRMPYLDGFEVMEIFNTISNRSGDMVPIIVLTAQIDRETRVRALELGAKDFITKPFEQGEVLLRIHNMLTIRHAFSVKVERANELEEAVKQRTQEVEETRLQIIRALARAGELRDNETGMHVMRMSHNSEKLALAMGFNEHKAHMMLLASPMHDIGKIGIPDDILLKPGKLNEEEWRIMRQHPQIAIELLGDHDSEVMQLARTIALNHHEKFDGSGYPAGKKGEEIPIEVRIVTVCDVFDALISDRPYKKGWAADEALQYINDNVGSHFDPECVAAFNSIIDQITVVNNKFKD